MAASTYEDILRNVEQLTPDELLRLHEQITVMVDGIGQRPVPRRRSSYGALAHLGQAPSGEEIDDARREVWTNFPRDDVA